MTLLPRQAEAARKLKEEERSTWRKKAALLRAYVQGRPVWISWQVTYLCNFECVFCDYWSYPVDRAKETSPAGFRAAGQKLAKLGSFMISLAGGEPFIRQDLEAIVEALSAYHFPLLTTNGWLVTPERARRLYEAGLWGASVSIDFATPEKHDAYRGKQGAFERAVRALRSFSAARFAAHQQVNLITVLNDQNISEVEDLIKLAAAHQAGFMIQPYGMMKTGEARFLHRGKVSSYLLGLKRRYPNFLSNPIFLEKFDIALQKGVQNCRAGKSFFNIDHYGNVSICVENLNDPVGNIHTHSVRELFAALAEKQQGNTCTACWYNCRGEIESLYTVRGIAASLPRLVTA